MTCCEFMKGKMVCFRDTSLERGVETYSRANSRCLFVRLSQGVFLMDSPLTVSAEIGEEDIFLCRRSLGSSRRSMNV